MHPLVQYKAVWIHLIKLDNITATLIQAPQMEADREMIEGGRGTPYEQGVRIDKEEEKGVGIDTDILREIPIK